MQGLYPAHTPSGRMRQGMLKVAGLIPSRSCTDLCCEKGAQKVLPMRVWCNGQSIGSTVSGVIVRSRLWSTATRSYQ